MMHFNLCNFFPLFFTVQEQDIKRKQSLYEKYGKFLLVTKVLLCELPFTFGFLFCHALYLFITNLVNQIGNNLCRARSVLLEYSCNYSSPTSSTALWYVDATRLNVLDRLLLSICTLSDAQVTSLFISQQSLSNILIVWLNFAQSACENRERKFSHS